MITLKKFFEGTLPRQPILFFFTTELIRWTQVASSAAKRANVGLCRAVHLVFLYAFACHKVKGHADADRADGIFAASVAVLPRCVHSLLTGRRLRSNSVHLAQAGTQATANQGRLHVCRPNIYLSVCNRRTSNNKHKKQSE